MRLCLIASLTALLMACSGTVEEQSDTPGSESNAAETGTETPTDSNGTDESSGEMGEQPTDQESMVNTCGTDHPLVGRSAEFSMLFHDVSGTVAVLDKCTLRVTNFNYDGGGPDVAFYAYFDGDYFHPDAFQIGDQLNGQRFDDQTLVLTLPEGKSLDNFDSISVWCFEFGISFGEAYLTQ